MLTVNWPRCAVTTGYVGVTNAGSALSDGPVPARTIFNISEPVAPPKGAIKGAAFRTPNSLVVRSGRARRFSISDVDVRSVHRRATSSSARRSGSDYGVLPNAYAYRRPTAPCICRLVGYFSRAA